MSSFKIKPPRAFFDLDSENMDEKASKRIESTFKVKDEDISLSTQRNSATPSNRFNFSSVDLVNGKQQKKVGINTGTMLSSVGSIDVSDSSKFVFVFEKATKSSYSYNGLKKPRFDESTKKQINWGDMMTQNQNKKAKEQSMTAVEIEQKNAKEEIFDLFGGMDTEQVKSRDEDRNEATAGKINEYLSVLNSNEVAATTNKKDKDKTSVKGVISSDTFFNNLYNLMQYLNAEERGRFLISAAFGCLISRSKFLGVGGKSGISKFADLSSAFSSLVSGGSSNTNSKLYNSLIEICSSPKLNKYRTDSSVGDQVSNMTNFINRIASAKLPVFFPLSLQWSDPIAVYIGTGKTAVLDLKIVALSRTPSTDNLKDFFGSSVVKAKTSSSGGNKTQDAFSNEFDDVQESMTRGSKGGDWQMDRQGGGVRDGKFRNY